MFFTTPSLSPHTAIVKDIIRIGLIGTGRRGLKTLERYAYIPDAQICAIADLDPEHLADAQRMLSATARPEALTFQGEEGWREMCRSTESDLIYICTDWQSHAAMAIYAMEQGKDVAVEVPAATTVDECRALVETARRTHRQCFMTENCCYDRFSLACYEMNRQGLFGSLRHLEGAYIHEIGTENSLWMEKDYAHHGGNPYPTHGLGPMAWLLGLGRTDHMDYLVSMTSAEGYINSTLIRTRRGVTIRLDLDVTTQRPYSRLQTICGSDGFAQKYPVPTIQTRDSGLLTGDAALQLAARYETDEAARCWHKGRELGVPNEMNYTMDMRLIQALRHGQRPDITVEDAASWSCIAELSQQSARNGSKPVSIPDFYAPSLA